jgi:hypothetical protein
MVSAQKMHHRGWLASVVMGPDGFVASQSMSGLYLNGFVEARRIV